MTPAEQAVIEARSHVGAPYFYGADGPSEFDCNGLLERCWLVAGVYPWATRRAAAIYPSLPQVAWNDRLPGDAVCYGSWAGGAHHVVIVASFDELIGANHGTPPLSLENDEDYRRRMRAQDGGAGARVCIVPADYWRSERLCVVRPEGLR